MTHQHPCCQHSMNGLKKYLVGVAIAVTTALLGQSVGLVWWAATITTRMEHVEKELEKLSGQVHAMELGRPPYP